MLSRIWRLLQHRWVDERMALRGLGPEGLRRIEERVAASETKHSGEIRVCIEAGLPWSYIRRSAPARERALALFGKLRVWDTEHNNGVLIYLLLAERRIELVADRGVDRRVDAAEWSAIVDALGTGLSADGIETALHRAIDAVDAHLVRHFPVAPGEANPNELPDAPDLR
jgi:uncharacterized membrane protein